MDVDRDAKLFGNCAGAVGRVGIDQYNFIQQGHIVHQGLLDGCNNFANRLFFIQGRQGQADGGALLLFELHKLLQVGELVGVEGVFGKPLVDQNGDGLRAGAFIQHRF